MDYKRASGMVHPLLIATIVLGTLAAGLGGFGLWSFLSYQDQKNNVDAKIAVAVATAKQQQTVKDQANFDEQEKLPNRQLIGPVDLGQVTFSYPKTWSVYVDHNGTNSSYEAYLYPGFVPPLTSATPYALRVSVVNSQYETILATYSEMLKNGKLKASPVTIGGVDGMRLDGQFSPTVTGAMVIFKIRDKTLQVYTQSNTFIDDFNNTIVKTLEFNK